MVYKILVLEDDIELRDTLAEVLLEEGYQVVAVERGEEAVRKVANEPFDLIVSDIRMDGMDGLEAIDRSRQLQPGLSSLVVSGYASEKETLRALHLNVGGYLRKPFSLKEFLQSVQGVLEKQAQQLRHQREVEGYRTAFAWAIKTLSELGDEAGIPRPEGGLSRVSHLCEAMAHRVGLPSAVAQQVGWATVVAILSGQGRSSALSANLLPNMGELARTSSFLASLLALGGVEQQIVRLGLYLWQQPDLPLLGEVPSELLEGPLQEAYQKVRQQVLDSGRPLDLDILRALSDSVQRERSLLALAGALEESQDLASAAYAYREIVDSKKSQPDATLGQATLGLARLAKKQGNSSAQAEWLERVSSCSRALSPQTGCHLLLEAGLLCGQKQFLQDAEVLARQAGNPTVAVKARFALLRLGESLADDAAAQARVLLDPAARSEVATAWRWLLPIILDTVEAADRPLFRLVLDFSREVAELLSSGALSAKARHTILSGLESQDYAVPEELSQALIKDERADIRQRALLLVQRGTEDQPTVSLRIQSFGFFQVLCGSRKILESDWRTQKIKFVLAYLAAAGGRPVTEDELLEEFWPDSRGSKRNLYVATYEMRRVLRPHPNAKEVDYIVRERGLLYLNQQLPVWHDAKDCETLLAEGGVQNFRRIAGLYTGPYLEGCYQEWAVRRRATWEERMLRVLITLAEHCLSGKESAEALEFSARALELDNGNSQAHLCKMRAHLQMRQPEAVIRHFEAAEKLLRKEYEQEPTLEMIEVYTRARHGIFD